MRGVAVAVDETLCHAKLRPPGGCWGRMPHPVNRALNSHSGRLVIVQVFVRDNDVDQALRVLKKKMQREGLFREMKLRRSYEKPSERRARQKAENKRRHRKLMRKRLEREGY